MTDISDVNTGRRPPGERLDKGTLEALLAAMGPPGEDNAETAEQRGMLERLLKQAGGSVPASPEIAEAPASTASAATPADSLTTEAEAMARLHALLEGAGSEDAQLELMLSLAIEASRG